MIMKASFKFLALTVISLSSEVFGADYKCHGFCSTPTILAEMNILNSTQIKDVFSDGKDLESAFVALQKQCKTINKNAVPLRYLHAPTSAQNQVKIVLVPALSGDICSPVY